MSQERTVLLQIDLDAPEREVVEIGEQRYTLRHVDDLPINDNAAAFRRVNRFYELLTKSKAAELEPADEAEFVKVLRTLCEQALEAPADVIDRLTQGHQIRIVNLFFFRRMPPAQGAAESAAAAAS